MHWYHTQEVIELQTPSRNDGIDFETEARYRKEGARFIMELGNKLGLRYLTMATGIVFYHRFYMFHSFKEFSRWVTGATCLFLAGKVEETPKKCRDILKFGQQSLTDMQFKTFGDNPREEVMICERILLQTIKFDLQLNHPYQYLIKYGKLLKGEKSKINELVQKAWIFINDSLSTTLCLIYKPQVVALAVLLLAFKLSNQTIRDLMAKPRVDWWKEFYAEADENQLEDICKELMNMYDGKPPKRRFPNRHIEKIKNGSQSNSPQTPGSPQAKKQRMASPITSTSNQTTPSNSTPSTTTTVTTSISSSTTAVTEATVDSTTVPIQIPKREEVAIEPTPVKPIINTQPQINSEINKTELKIKVTSIQTNAAIPQPTKGEVLQSHSSTQNNILQQNVSVLPLKQQMEDEQEKQEREGKEQKLRILQEKQKLLQDTERQQEMQKQLQQQQNARVPNQHLTLIQQQLRQKTLGFVPQNQSPQPHSTNLQNIQVSQQQQPAHPFHQPPHQITPQKQSMTTPMQFQQHHQHRIPQQQPQPSIQQTIPQSISIQSAGPTAQAPILDHMSSFFNPSYNQYNNQSLQMPTFNPFASMNQNNAADQQKGFPQQTMPPLPFNTMAPLPPPNMYLDTTNFQNQHRPVMMQPNMPPVGNLSNPNRPNLPNRNIPPYGGRPWMQ